MLALVPSFLLCLASALLSPSEAHANPVPVAPRAGAPLTLQTLHVANLTECGVANISWTGPGTEPYALTIGLGAFLYGPGTPLVTYPNLTHPSSVQWIVSEPVGASLYFALVDATGQTTHTQGHLVTKSTNASFVPAHAELANGTVVCPAGVGRLNGSTAAAAAAGRA